MNTEQEKLITISILSSEGDTTVTGTASEILTRIQEEGRRKKWLYIGTQFRDPDTITMADLLENEEPITLTNALAGG